ncbi:MAG: L,D-transpeptidase family protein [Magnetospiraceae bacterium]
MGLQFIPLVAAVGLIVAAPLAAQAANEATPLEAAEALMQMPASPEAQAIYDLAQGTQDFHLGGIHFRDAAIARFYEQRAWEPAWTRESDLRALTEALTGLEDHGLTPTRYPTPEALLAYADTQAEQGRLDVMRTATFLRFTREVSHGLVSPRGMYPDYDVPEPAFVDAVAALQSAIVAGDGEMAAVLKSMAPPHIGYWQLVDAHRALRLREDWPQVAGLGRKLKPGKSHENVPSLRARLAVEPGETLETPEDPTQYDAALEEAVRRFQDRHGLLVDGVVGPRTLRTLNVSREDRLQQVVASLERWRWIPRDLGTAYVMVNAAANRLWAVQDGKTVFETRVITGTKKNPTPVLQSHLKQMVLNPPWYVPKSIATKEIMIKAQEDPEYLRRNNIRVVDLEEDDPFGDTVDWNTASENGEIYRFRQDPGAGNALGHLKLFFTNKYGVYLHDTSSRSLFGRANRNLSHGCVRVQNVRDLAALIGAPRNGWDRTRIDGAIQNGKTRYVPMPHDWNIYLLYWTAFTDSDGGLRFRHDVYGRDVPLLRALEEAASLPGSKVASSR